MNNINLSVIIPSYNEMPNLQKGVLDKINQYLSSQSYHSEVLIVDDGSDDGSLEFCEKFVAKHKRFRLMKGKHSGKAGAVTAGMLGAKGKNRLFTDMDQATPIEEVEKFLPLFAEGFDVVIGSRKERIGSPMSRRFMSKSMIVLRKLLVGVNEINDTQCGFKMFSEKSAEKIFKKIKEMHEGFSKISGSNVTAGFDIEILLLASEMGLKIKEVPVEWLYVESRRVSPIKDSINGVFDLLQISSNKSKGKYKV